LLHAPAALALGEKRPVPISKENFLVPGPVWMLWRIEKAFSLLGIELRSVVITIFLSNVNNMRSGTVLNKELHNLL
jgi:hypothetical protein